MADTKEKTTDTKHVNGTQIGHLNVYHLFNKVADVTVLLNEPQNIHILGLSETRLDNRITNEMLSIPHYKIIRKDATHPGETGLAMYIHDSLFQYTYRRKDLESSAIECIWVELKYTKFPPMLLGFIYRNPASSYSWIQHFDHMMDNIISKNQNILLLGDLNFDLLKPQTTWEPTIAQFGLTQRVQKATRVTATSSTLLDHIYTNNTSLVTNVRVPEVGISDHFPTICTWLYNPPKVKTRGHTTT